MNRQSLTTTSQHTLQPVRGTRIACIPCQRLRYGGVGFLFGIPARFSITPVQSPHFALNLFWILTPVLWYPTWIPAILYRIFIKTTGVFFLCSKLFWIAMFLKMVFDCRSKHSFVYNGEISEIISEKPLCTRETNFTKFTVFMPGTHSFLAPFRQKIQNRVNPFYQRDHFAKCIVFSACFTICSCFLSLKRYKARF